MAYGALLRSLFRGFWLLLALLPLVSVPVAAQDDNREAVVVVLDVSNSMWGRVDGRPKIEIAREALGQLIADWKPEVDLGLIAFGHRREGDCGDIEMVQPIGPVDAARFSQTIAGLTPTGKTPMTAAIRQAAEALRYKDRPATVILFSDGIETCNADPCALASELEAGGVRFTAHVIGLDVGEGEHQLSCLAEGTGGLYLTAKDPEELKQALDTVADVATEPEKGDLITLEAVLEGSDTPIREGVVWRVVALPSETSVPITAGTSRPQLPLEPGQYLIEARLGDAQAHEEIAVVADTSATHRLVLDASQAAVVPPPPPVVAEAVGPGLIIEREQNSSFGQPTSPPVRPEAEAAMPRGGISFGQAQRVDLPASGTVGMAPGRSTWVRFAAVSQGQLTVAAQPPVGVEFSVRLWNREQQGISDWRLLSGQPLTFDLAAPADYILEFSSKTTAEVGLDVQISLTPTGDVSEPNDSFAKATPITLGRELFGTILPARDGDWFSVDIAEQGQAVLELAQAVPDLELVVRLWDREQAGQNWMPLNVGQPVAFDINKPGIYRFELRDGGDDERSLGQYRINSAFKPTGDRREPNDTFGTATPITSGEELVGTLFPASDADWFLLDLAEQGRVSLLLSAEPAGLQPLVRLWNSEQQGLSDWQQLRRDQPTHFDLGQPGRYLLELRDSGNDERTLESYRLTATLVPTGDALEPNNSFGQPAVVDATGEYEGAILPRGDAEWLAVDIPTLGALEVEQKRPVNELQMIVRLWNSEQQGISDWLNLQAGKATFDLVTPGRYFLEFRDSGDDNASPERYRIGMNFKRADVASLSPAPGEGIFTGTMFPKGDGDYLEIAATAAGNLTLTAESVPPEIQLVARIWDADQRGISDWLNLLPGSAQTQALGAAGRYTIEFRDSGNDERSLTPYRVAVVWPGSDLVVRQEGDAPPPVNDIMPPVTQEKPPVVVDNPPVVDDKPPAIEKPPVTEEKPPVVVEKPPVTGDGRWTEWFDIDDPGASGDWEPLPALIDAKGVCEAPVAIECQTLDGRDWSTTGQVYRCEPKLGGICRTKDQLNQQECLDYRVRFTCP